MLLMSDKDFYPDKSELHRFGADPTDQLLGPCSRLAQADWPCSTEHEAAQLLWLLNLLCKALQGH